MYTDRSGHDTAYSISTDAELLDAYIGHTCRRMASLTPEELNRSQDVCTGIFLLLHRAMKSTPEETADDLARLHCRVHQLVSDCPAECVTDIMVSLMCRLYGWENSEIGVIDDLGEG